jgi:Flp pilus assembly protein TadG
MTCGFQRRRAKHGAPVRAAFARRERGSSLLEQSFILVFLLTVMFGIIDCGRALYTYHFVSNVAREASRWASVRSQSCDGSALSGCPGDLSGDNLRTAFKANLSSMGLDPTKVTFTTSWVVPPGVGAASCPTPISNNVGCMVHVDVTYAYTFLFAPFIAAPAINMSSSSEMLITN